MAKDINKKEFTEETKLKLEIFQECFREWYPVFIHHKYITNVLIYDMLQEVVWMRWATMVHRLSYCKRQKEKISNTALSCLNKMLRKYILDSMNC